MWFFFRGVPTKHYIYAAIFSADRELGSLAIGKLRSKYSIIPTAMVSTCFRAENSLKQVLAT
jgi:hypothetical protein